jgi:radical SAM protein with 4Fe4S-binding SPASM domain
MKYWKIHQNIFFTKGFNRTLVFDSLKSKIQFIPNDLYDVLLEKKFIISEEDIDGEYFEFLKENSLIFTDRKKILKRFTQLSYDFSINYDIGICVIELSKSTGENLSKLIEKEDKYTSINQFNFIFGSYTSKTSILNFVDFICKYEVDLIELTFIEGFNEIDFLFSSLNDINRMFVINNFLDEKIKLNDTKYSNRMHSYVDIKSLKIYTSLFSFFESKFYNIYFYNKIFIDKDSNIKNSDKTSYSYGSLKELNQINFKEIINDKGFTKYWHSKKDETLICKDCEFRNLCSDNRVPNLNSKNIWIHSQECEYNPYISKWNDENGYLNLNDSGVSMLNESLIINKEKLNKINETLWD